MWPIWSTAWARCAPGIGPLGGVEGEAADQLGLEGVGELAGPGNVFLEVFLEGDVGVLGAVVDVQELDLADRRADRGDVQAVLVLQVADLLDFRLAEFHHVLDALADVDEAKAVVLQPQGGKGGELLFGRLLIGGFVGKAGEDRAVGRPWLIPEGERFSSGSDSCDRIVRCDSVWGKGLLPLSAVGWDQAALAAAGPPAVVSGQWPVGRLCFSITAGDCYAEA